MSFWNTSDGGSADKVGGSFEMGGGDLAPIPAGTNVLAIAEEAKTDQYNNDQYVSVKWRISKPTEYANRVIFQKVQIYHADTHKADKAKRMLAAIASNAGGGLFTSMRQRNETSPSDQSLMQICNRPMVLKLDIWELDDKSKRGNWVQAVSQANGATAQSAPAVQTAPPPAPPADNFDVPF